MTLRDRIRRIQRAVGVQDDGLVGRDTLTALERALGLVERTPAPEITYDARTEKCLATLLPAVQPAFRNLVELGKEIAAAEGVEFRLISGSRTYAEQDELYAQGRTTPGRRVTNARGGYSNHNFGLAADAGWFRGPSYLDADRPGEASRLHRKLANVALGEGLPLEWGGDWDTFRDEPHWQYRTGLSTSQMRARVARGEPLV